MINKITLSLLTIPELIEDEEDLRKEYEKSRKLLATCTFGSKSFLELMKAITTLSEDHSALTEELGKRKDVDSDYPELSKKFIEANSKVPDDEKERAELQHEVMLHLKNLLDGYVYSQDDGIMEVLSTVTDQLLEANNSLKSIMAELKRGSKTNSEHSSRRLASRGKDTSE